MRREWQIKLVLTEQQQDQWGLLIENLRYAGILHREEGYNTKGDPSQVLFFYCPKRLSPKIWADMNCQRMKTFGLNATPVLR